MSALLKLLELSPGDDTDIWVGPPSGPDGKRSYGGQFVAQSLAAACHTVDADRPPTNMHLQFLRGGEAGDPVEYTVARVFVARGRQSRPTAPRALIRVCALGILGVANGPGEPLDELGCRVAGAQMHRVHLLVEQHRRVVRELERVGCDNDSGHRDSLAFRR